MQTEQYQTAVDRFADAMIQDEYKRQQEHNPERFASTPPELFQQFEARTKARAEQLATEIVERGDALIKGMLSGRFHPDNRFSRRLFTDLTGLTLPPTKKETLPIIAAYIGQDRIDAYTAARQAEADAKAEAERLKEQATTDKRAAEISEQVSKGDMIDGEDLVFLCRYLGIELHPRTAGTLKARVVGINDGQSKVRRTRSGNFQLGTAAYEAYRECRDRIANGVAL